MAFDGITMRDGAVHGQPTRALALEAPADRRTPPRLRKAVPGRPSQPSTAERELAELRRQTAILRHDFNNLLNVILGANEALADRLDEDPEGRELAQISQDAAERGGALLSRLGELAEPSAAPAVDCAELVAAAGRLARMSLPPSVVVEAQAAAEPLRCPADRADLDSALLNLCVNAGHAMPRGGALTISAAPADLDVETARALRLTPGAYVALTVADNGVGMTPEVLARATEAYFTTRRGGGGTGLGLASVQAFAAQAGGGLSLASEAGHGTAATLYLPRV